MKRNGLSEVLFLQSSEVTMFQMKRMQLLVAAAFAVAGSGAYAVEFSIEGKISRILPEGATGAAVESVVCNGSTIVLKPTAAASGSTVYSTPSSADVAKADFFSSSYFPGFEPAVLPGSPPVGLLGGTCIIDGNSVGTTLYADKFFGEPAENVLVGPVTSGPAERFAIMGVPIILLTDDRSHMDSRNPADPNAGTPDPARRISATRPTNQFSYPVVLSTVPRDDLSSAEGYLSADGKAFYAFAVETTGGSGPVSEDAAALLAPTVQRATLEFRSATASRLEIRGGCVIGNKDTLGVSGTAPNRVQNIRIVVDSTIASGAGTPPVTTWFMPNNAASNQSDVGAVNPVPTATNASCTEDPATPGSGVYRFRVDNYTYGGVTGRATPVNVKIGIPGKTYGTPVAMERIKFP